MALYTIKASEIKAATANKQDSPNTPWLASYCCVQGSNAWWYRTFLQYDLSDVPKNAKIISANLCVYCNWWNDNTASGTTNISRITEEWEEATLTWNHQPATTGTYLSANVPPPSKNFWSKWDITTLVKEWLEGTYPNYGLYIKNNNEGAYRYDWHLSCHRTLDGNATYIEITYDDESSNRTWNFQGKLKENNKRVITQIEGRLTETEQGEEPNFEALSFEDGRVILDLKIPKQNLESNIVGKQYIVDGSSTNAAGQKYGEIFNDYVNNTALGAYSHVTGYGTKGDYPYQAIFGKYNQNKKNNVIEVGFGDSASSRRNIFELNKEGNITIPGDITSTSTGLSLTYLEEKKLDKIQFDYLVQESLPRLHTYTNESEINAAAAVEQPIISTTFTTTNATTPLFFATIPFTLTEEAIVTFRYYLDNVLQEDDTLQQKFDVGTHFATLFNYLTIGENFAGIIKVTITVSQGSLNILPYSIKSTLYVQGVGITAAWNGKINITENFTPFNLPTDSLSISKVKEDVSVIAQVPIGNNIVESIKRISLTKNRMSILGYTDNVQTAEVFTNYTFSVLRSLVDPYDYNKYFISTENEQFQMETFYDFGRGTELIVSNDGGGSVQDINTTIFKSVEKVDIVMENVYVEEPSKLHKVVFSVEDKDKYVYNPYYFNETYFMPLTVYNKLGVEKIVNDNGSGTVLDIKANVFKAVQSINIVMDNIFTKQPSDLYTNIFSIENKENYIYNSYFINDSESFMLYTVYNKDLDNIINETDNDIILALNIPAYIHQETFEINTIMDIRESE